MRFDRPVYGPGPLRSKGSRVLLAAAGVEYPPDYVAWVEANRLPDEPAADAQAEVPADEPQPDELGIINRGNGWYELPNGDRVRGRANAEQAVADLGGGLQEHPGTGEPMEPIEVPVGESGELVVDGDLPPDPDSELVADETGLVPLGGDWFQLPDGQRVRGRDAAETALEALSAEES